ncbi:hypothetical protein DBT_1357 [Dissulfuribacter thermophilus]|uniref:Uncharacterized protein n=1 Tax=Dissulfuribacter thermophilus TaxID=1156395 RepID=A0A1B9F5W8_9BACT|nr:hypothetical protein DBT_1357 [Dissulfuribacter thermophilus]
MDLKYFFHHFKNRYNLPSLNEKSYYKICSPLEPEKAN